MIKVIVCGGRNFSDQQKINKILAEYIHPYSMIIHGGASGADSLAEKWAKKNGVHTAIVNARWENFGHKAGPMRNRKMLSLNPDLCIAFPGGKGTKHMVSLCKDLEIEVIEVDQ